MEDYEVFENCTKVDILLFLVDWVVHGQTEEHNLVGLKIFETVFEEESYCEEDIGSDQERHSNQKALSDIEPKHSPRTHDTNEPECDQESNAHQCGQQSRSDHKLQDEQGQNCNQRLPGSQESENDQPQTTNDPENNGEQQINKEESPSIGMEQKSDDEGQLSDEEQPLYRHRPGFDIALAIEKIKCKLDSGHANKEFTEKCLGIVDKEFCFNTTALCSHNDFGSATNTGESNQDLPEPVAEQVLIAVAPKKCLKDFLAKSESFESEISSERDEAIFDICVYVPRKQSWYYIGEGTNEDKFKEIGKKDSRCPISFCMNDKLCCVSLDKNSLYIYPLNQNEDCCRGRQWSAVSFDYLIRKSTDSETEFDKKQDVRFCCNDRENVYLVMKIKRSNDWDEDLRIEFNCYRLSDRQSWKLVFGIPLTDDLDVYESRHFDVHVSPDNNDMLIVVEGYQLHVFRVNLEDGGEGFQEYTLDDENRLIDFCEMHWIPHPHFWIIRSKKHLSFVDEIYADETGKRYYRNVMIKDKVEGLSVDFTEHRVSEPRLPGDYPLETTAKLFQSVGTGSSAWLYLSDGKFQTSLDEIRLSKYGGFLNFNRHISPPFQSVTLLAAGMVKKEILANLKPVKEFLQE